MQADTIEWLTQILRPFFISVMSDPDHLVFSKMLPNPVKLATQDDLQTSNHHTRLLVSSNFTNFFTKDEILQTQARFLYKIKELTDTLNSNADRFQPPTSLRDYIAKVLLYEPDLKQLWNYELNRIAFLPGKPRFLDTNQLDENAEGLMLVGMLVIAKFLIVKIFLNSHRYPSELSGVQFSQSQVLNLKVIGTILYHSFKQFTDTIQLKNRDTASSDSDGGMTSILFD